MKLGDKTIELLRIEYRVWNPFRSKLGAGIVGGIGACPVKPGAKVLYLGGASGTTVSHVSDMVGPEGAVLNALIFFGTSSVTKRLKRLGRSTGHKRYGYGNIKFKFNHPEDRQRLEASSMR